MSPSPSPSTVSLYRTQAAFWRCPAFYRAFCGGRGAGKSFVGGFDLATRARRDRTYMIVGPTYPVLRDSSMRSFLKMGRETGAIDPSTLKLSAPPQVSLVNGASVLFRSADDPERLRGPNLSGVWLDEASLMRRDAYDICIASLREGGEQGWLSATFTPKGPAHWTHEVFATGRPDTALFRARTAANPFLPPDFEATLRGQYGGTNFARQELGGEFVQLEGSEFSAEWFGWPGFWFTDWPENPVLKVVALDPSKGTDGRGQDYQAHVLVAAAIEDGRYVYYADADMRREGVVEMTRRTIDLCRQFATAGNGRLVDSVVVEDNSTMGLLPPAFDAAEVRANYVVPWMCRHSSDNKEFRIRYYAGPPLSRRQIRFRDTPGGRMLVGQLQSFPQDEFDDGPDALAAALRRVAEMLPAG